MATQRSLPQRITPINAVWGKEYLQEQSLSQTYYFKEKKDVFLSNSTNEHHMINVISTEIKKAGCYGVHSHDDADVDIVKLILQNSLILQSSLECSITVIGEDADLLVLLLYHADINSKPLYFKSSKESNEMEIRNILKRLLHNTK